VRREELPFVRSFARSLVRLSSWSKEIDIGEKKSDDGGKKEQKYRTGRKKGLKAKSGFEIWSA
jgi:hypothetical protein